VPSPCLETVATTGTNITITGTMEGALTLVPGEFVYAG
jgi:hypothetical protein